MFLPSPLPGLQISGHGLPAASPFLRSPDFPIRVFSREPIPAGRGFAAESLLRFRSPDHRITRSRRLPDAPMSRCPDLIVFSHAPAHRHLRMVLPKLEARIFS